MFLASSWSVISFIGFFPPLKTWEHVVLSNISSIDECAYCKCLLLVNLTTVHLTFRVSSNVLSVPVLASIGLLSG